MWQLVNDALRANEKKKKKEAKKKKKKGENVLKEKKSEEEGKTRKENKGMDNSCMGERPRYAYRSLLFTLLFFATIVAIVPCHETHHTSKRNSSVYLHIDTHAYVHIYVRGI